MRKSSKIRISCPARCLLLAGCALHPRDFIPNGAGVNLQPTDPAHVQVLDSIPRGMIIGTVLVDRSKAKNTQDIIEAARVKSSLGGRRFHRLGRFDGDIARRDTDPGRGADSEPMASLAIRPPMWTGRYLRKPASGRRRRALRWDIFLAGKTAGRDSVDCWLMICDCRGPLAPPFGLASGEWYRCARLLISDSFQSHSLYFRM